MNRHEEAAQIALEHTRYCMRRGISPRQLIHALRSIDVRNATWDDAFFAVEQAWLSLPPVDK